MRGMKTMNLKRMSRPHRSSHLQLETLKETVSRVRKKMACIRQDNERLQRRSNQSSSRSNTRSASPPGNDDGLDRRARVC